MPGFAGTGALDVHSELQWQKPMRALHREFILVFMNAMFNGEDPVFADSANNGPWGQAFTTEFIPLTEQHFRATGTPQSRFVAGHSSGGWAALWLQVNYPGLFGGEWSIAPDPVDFHDFTGPDITRAPAQNFYHDASGHAYGFFRRGTRDTETLEQFVHSGGWAERQVDSFDAVFSPRGANGAPEPLFDRKTGVIDPHVASYWEAHYDIAHILAANWSTLGPQLRGKIHVIVGTEDTFHLEGSAQLLRNELAQLPGSDAEFDFVPGADHGTVLSYGGGIETYIISEACRLNPDVQ
jgi:S-formylglutathione hydrolase FrmB